MITETKGDLWDISYNDYWRVIPTNGSVNKQGLAVMGQGVALQATSRYPHLQKDLGDHLRKSGLQVLLYSDRGLVIFPVKFAWYERASMTLIEKSCGELVNYLLSSRMKVVMPRVGCGNGGLAWNAVRPILKRNFGGISNEIVVLDYEKEGP